MVHHGHWKTVARCSQEPDWDGSDYKNKEEKEPVRNHKSYDTAKCTQKEKNKKKTTIKPFSNY